MDEKKCRSVKKLLDDKLGSQELEMLKFLSGHILESAVIDHISRPSHIVAELHKLDLINPENSHLLAELLFEIHRIDLMRLVDITKDDLRRLRENYGSKINPYKLMLHHLSESMIRSDVAQFRSLIEKSFGLISSEPTTVALSAYQLFFILEERKIMSECDVSQLLSIMEEMDESDLRNIVSNYMDNHSIESKRSSSFSLEIPASSESSNTTDSNQELSAPDAMASSMKELSLKISDYPIHSQSGKTKGICLIINNEMFDPANHKESKEELKGPRLGTAYDLVALETIFAKLSFDVHVHKNLSSKELRSKMKRYSEYDHSSYDVFVCCILTHGEAGRVFGIDCLPISIHSILSHFVPKRCKSLEDKPKIFFIQACQGGRQTDDSLDSIPLIDGSKPAEEEVDVDLMTDYGRLSRETNVPRQPDYLLGLATVPGFVSYRSKSTGSWYIQALCALLTKLHNKFDLLSILTEVTNEVLKKEKKNRDILATQIPLPQHTLRKRVYFYTS